MECSSIEELNIRVLIVLVFAITKLVRGGHAHWSAK